MGNGFVTVDGVHRKGTESFITTDGVYRKCKEGYRTVCGVYEQIVSSGVKWNKYECTRTSTKTYEDFPVNIGETDGHVSTIGVAGTIFHKNYWWGTDKTGYVVRNPVTVTRDTISEALGKYHSASTTYKGEQYQAICQVYSVNPDTYEWDSKVVATAKPTTEYAYEKGALIGTVEAPEGERPENLTHVTSNSRRTILRDGSVYYWYEPA